MKYKQMIIPASMAALAIAAAVGYEGHNPNPTTKTEIKFLINQTRTKNMVTTKKTEIKGNYVAVSPEDFTNVYDSSVLVHRSLTLEEKCKDSAVINHIGSGILLQDSQTGTEYVLTAEHLTVNQTFISKVPEEILKWIKDNGLTSKEDHFQ